MTRTSRLTLVLFLIAAAGCSGGSDGSADDESRAVDSSVDTAVNESGTRSSGGGFGLDLEPQAPVEWTYLVYSLSDTNLEEDMLADIEEMVAIGSTADVNVVALVDRSAEYTDTPVANLDDWDTAKLLYVEPNQLTEIADLGEIDMADPDSLAPFADYMLASDELEPGHGWDYGALDVIASDPTPDPEALGVAFVEGFEVQATAFDTSESPRSPTRGRS